MNPTVQLRVVNLPSLVASQDRNYLTLEAPEVVTEDHILGGVVWASTNEIAAHWLNRRQNQTVLRICNLLTDVCDVSSLSFHLIFDLIFIQSGIQVKLRIRSEFMCI